MCSSIVSYLLSALRVLYHISPLKTLSAKIAVNNFMDKIMFDIPYLQIIQRLLTKDCRPPPFLPRCIQYDT